MPDQKFHSKSEQRRVDALQEAANPPVKYRYYCERCTGIAFKSAVKVAPTPPKGQQLACLACLQPLLLPIKESNFILL